MTETPLPAHMWTVSKRGYDRLQKEEGFRATVYGDIGGKGTIGYGHRVYGAGLKRITKAQGEALLKADANKALRTIRTYVSRRLFQCQVDALVSLVFNIGDGAFEASHLRTAINTGNWPAIEREWKRWDHVGKREVAALKHRREREWAMFSEVPF